MIVYVNPWPSRNLNFPKPEPSKSNGKVIVRDRLTKAVKSIYFVKVN